jgi:hypothetical protein
MQVQRTQEPHAGLPRPRCGAKTRRGARGPCSNVAGFRTDHVGQGRCYLHGGSSQIKSGRYSALNSVRLRDLIAEHEADPDPLNTLPELAQLGLSSRTSSNATRSERPRSSPGTRRVGQQGPIRRRSSRCSTRLEELQRGKGIELTDKQSELLQAARRRASQQLNPEHERPKSILDISDASDQWPRSRRSSSASRRRALDQLRAAEALPLWLRSRAVAPHPGRAAARADARRPDGRRHMTMTANEIGVGCCGNCGAEVEVRCSGGCAEPDVEIRENAIAAMKKPTGPNRLRPIHERFPTGRKSLPGICTYRDCMDPIAPREPGRKGRPSNKCAKHLAYSRRWSGTS